MATVVFSVTNNTEQPLRISMNSLIAAAYKLQLQADTKIEYECKGPDHITPLGGKQEFRQLVKAKESAEIPVLLSMRIVRKGMSINDDPMHYHEDKTDVCSASAAFELRTVDESYNNVQGARVKCTGSDVDVRWYSRRGYPERRQLQR